MSLTSRQRRTHKARSAFLTQFEDDDARRDHMLELADRSAERRRGGVVLSADEVAALGSAYALIDRIYQRHAAKLARAAEGEAGHA